MKFDVRRRRRGWGTKNYNWNNSVTLTLCLKCTENYYDSEQWNLSRKTLNNIKPNARPGGGGIEGL